ncbi:hypothetical protein EHW65_14035 [Erwinia psidii]|uniref:phage holin family protein n=1 Tax=Erwinia psidii TaxID=69224 RepID=UPI00226B013A|nr:phage holin family protein [Erwinia psidii]MCX8958330.1 hypothetical protein [Erwinia psidii]
MEHPNLPPDFVAASITWLKHNAPVIYGALASFGMATLITLRDGKSWLNALMSGAICCLIALGVINSLEFFGLSSDNALLVGTIIGGMGVERCLALMTAFAHLRSGTASDERNKK